MATFSLPELLTLTLYLATVTAMLVALATPHEPTQRMSATVSILVGALATYCLLACYTGAAESWVDDSRPAFAAQPAARDASPNRQIR